MSEIVIWPNILHEALSSSLSVTSGGQVSISTNTSKVAIPLELTESITIDLFEIFLNTGVSSDFRCQIVTSDVSSNYAYPTTTLAHANATSTISATAGAWNQFDFTNFSLSSGLYWIVLDSISTPSTALAIQYSLDFLPTTAYSNSGLSGKYWSGSAWVTLSSQPRAMRARLKTTDGWYPLIPCAPLLGASGIDSLIMDTSENPACRGIRFVAPYTGEISGINISTSSFTSGTSFYIVMANAGCITELARVEYFQRNAGSTTYIHRLKFPNVSVTAGTSYDIYIKAGSQATASGGVYISALDTSEDSGNVIRCYGIEPGSVFGLYVNSPVTEGGSDVPTVTANHIFPWSPVYSSIVAGGETSHVFLA